MSYFGLPTIYPALDDFVIPEHKKIFYIVVDGLGMNFLERYGKDSFLLNHTKRQLTSVFPSTTSTALTSLMTGLAPLQHGLTGWYMYFRELGAAGIPLPFKARFTEKVFQENGVDIKDIFDFKTFFSKINNTTVISPSETINSAFSKFCFGNVNNIGYKTIEECFSMMKKQIEEYDEKRLIFTYIAMFDDIAHKKGIYSEQSIEFFNKLDKLFIDLSKIAKDKDCTMIITADHGLIDTTKETQLNLSDYPKIKECLILPLCGEPRIPYCYVRPQKMEQFIYEIENNFGEFCDRYSLDDILKKSLFGLGDINPKFFDRVGDEILIMKDNFVVFDKVYKEKFKDIVGFHGGLTREEMIVPLVVVSSE